MKKHIIISGILIVLAFVTGFFIGDSVAINRVNKQISSSIDNIQNDLDDIEVPNETDAEEEIEQEEQEKTEELPIKFEEIKPEIKILEPDSIGNLYMEATYTNNSDYPIVGYDMTVLLKDSNEKTYLTNYDTVMPGETSPKFESFGPKTQDPNDYEILKLEVTAKTETGNKLYIEYDFNLNEATWWESE